MSGILAPTLTNAVKSTGYQYESETHETRVLQHGFTIHLLVSLAGAASMALVVFPLSTASDEPGQNSTI
ncbi:MAG TPA: hypothetical protein DCL15_23685 [Chloroflexi bacterium]|nr:hypothetical protein [Chloroflexota bacterium]